MTSMIPLILLWMWSKRGGGGPSYLPQPPKPPNWPTSSSPPPPIPAFQPQAPPAPVPSADTGTPLPQLAAAAKAKPKPKPKPKPPPPAQRALRAAKGRVKLPKLAFGTLTKVAPVADLQTRINTHGGKLKRDGLYGPKTAAAWSAIAKKKGLPTQISRVGPKLAKVAIQTFEQLAIPPIP